MQTSAISSVSPAKSLRARFALMTGISGLLFGVAATGVRGKDPLATLSTFRARSNKTYFGWNLFVTGDGEIAVGDRVRLLA